MQIETTNTSTQPLKWLKLKRLETPNIVEGQWKLSSQLLRV